MHTRETTPEGGSVKSPLPGGNLGVLLTHAEALALGTSPYQTSRTHYGFTCDVCGGWIDSAARARCLARKLVATLCARDLAIALSLDALPRGVERRACKACGDDYLFDKKAHYDAGLRRAPREYAAGTRCPSCRASRASRLADERARRQADDDARRAERRAFYAGPGRRAFVYRLFDAEGTLLYVGKTYRPEVRFYGGPTSHSATKEWWPEVARIVVKTYRSDVDALAAEAWAIKRERPSYNVAHPRPWTARSPRSILTVSGDA